MQFIVRYWSSALPKEFRQPDGSMRMVDYSIHPPTRLGLHNAMLTRHDRVEILESYGGQFECEVYVVEGINSQVLTEDLAISLFNSLPSGEVKWISIREFLLPLNKEMQKATSQEAQHSGVQKVLHDKQMHLFEYTHQPDAIQHHHFDVDV